MAIPPSPRVPQPRASRSDFVESLNLNPTPVKPNLDLGNIVASLPQPQPQTQQPLLPPVILADPTKRPPKKKGGGLFDIPVIGPVIDLIDTPRAIAVSTVKEVGDLFAGDGFSVTDWWNQAEDNMMMGEVLRDWGVDLGGWNFALGLGLDIALDPLTYLTGGAMAARYAKSDDVANALLRAAGFADKSKDTAKAKMLSQAANNVKAKGAIHAAGREALQEIGLDTGLRFSVMGTGRIGRGIIERPLRKLFPELGKKLDIRRVDQLPQVGRAVAEATKSPIKNTSRFWRWGDEAIEGGPRFRRNIDWSLPKNREAILKQVERIRAGKPLKADTATALESGRLARQALRMPVEAKRFKIGASGFVRISAGAAGTLFGAATSTKIGRLVATQMSSKAPLNIGLREYAKQGDTEMVSILLNLKRAGNQGKVSSDIWATQSWEDIRALKRDADRLGADFDELVMQAAVEPKYFQGGLGPQGQVGMQSYAVANRNLINLNPKYLSDSGWASLHTRAQEMWGSMGKRGNQALPYSTPLQEVKDEFYVMRALKDDVARELGVVKDNNVFDVSIGGVGIESRLRGNIFSRRKYATPAGIKRAIAEGEISLEEVFKKAKTVEAEFSIDTQILHAEKGGLDLEPIRVRVAKSDSLKAELESGVGMRFETVDGSVMQNQFMGSSLFDVNTVRPDQARRGSVESQMREIGRDLLGDAYKEMFTDDAAEALSRYVNMWQSRIRSQYVIDYSNQLGITVEGVGDSWYGLKFGQIADQVAFEEAQRLATLFGKPKKGPPLMDQLSHWTDSVVNRARKVAQYDDWAERPARDGGAAVEGLEIPITREMDTTGKRAGTQEPIVPLVYSKDRQAYDTIVNDIATAEDKLATIEEVMALVNPVSNPVGRNTLIANRRAMLNLSPEAIVLLQDSRSAVDDFMSSVVGKRPTLSGSARKELTRRQLSIVRNAKNRAAALETYEEAVEFLRVMAEEIRLLSQYRDELAAFITQMRQEKLDLPFEYLIDQVLMIDQGIVTNKRWLEDVASTYVRNVIETDGTTIMADALYDLSMRGLAGNYRWATPKGSVTLPLRSRPQPMWELGGKHNRIVSIELEEWDPRWFKSQRESWTGHAEPLPITSGESVITTQHGFNPRFVNHEGSEFWKKLRFAPEDPVVDARGVPIQGTPTKPTALQHWVLDKKRNMYRPPTPEEAAEIKATGGLIGHGIPYEGRPVVLTIDKNTPVGRAVVARQQRALDAGTPQVSTDQALSDLSDAELIAFLGRNENVGATTVTPEQLLVHGGKTEPVPAFDRHTREVIEGPSREAMEMETLIDEARVGYARGRPPFEPDPRPAAGREIVQAPSYKTTMKDGKVVYDIPDYVSPVAKVREAAEAVGDKKSITWSGFVQEIEQIVKDIDENLLHYAWLEAIDNVPQAVRALEQVGQQKASIALSNMMTDKQVQNFLKGVKIPDAETTTVTEFIEILQDRVTAYRLGEAGDPKLVEAMETKIAELSAFKDQQLAVIDNAKQRLTKRIEDFTALRNAAMDSYEQGVLRQEELIAIFDAKNISTKKIIDELNLELDEVRQSIITKDRLSAIDNQKAAMEEVRKVRNFSSFADAYGGAANEYLLHMAPFQPALANIKRSKILNSELTSTISDTTRRALRNQNLVGVDLTDDQLIAWAEAFQAVAKTQDPTRFGAFMQSYMPLVNYWKALAVSTTGFFMRNLLGGAWINSAINDVPMSYHARVNEIRRAAVKAGNTQDVMEGIDALIAAGKPLQLPKAIVPVAGSRTVNIDELRAFKAWNEAGIGGSGQVSIEIKSQMDEFATWKSSRRPWKQKSWDSESRSFVPNDTEYMVQRGQANPFTSQYPYLSPEFKPISWIRSRNQDVEYMLRGAMAHHMMMSGYGLEDAMEMVVRHHFDYTDLTQMERRVKGIIPFWTWQKHIVPVLIESIGKKPAAWGRLAQVKKELELHSPVEGVVPDYFAENMGIRLPFSTAEGRVYWMPDLPFRDLTKWTKDMDSSTDLMGVPQNFWRVAKESAFPPIKLPFELWAGKQSFADIPLTGRFQQAPVWADVPVIRDALLATGVADRAPNGDLVMRDKHIYMFDQLMPIFGRARRLYPNERRKQSAFTTTFINTFLGAGIRVNSSMEQMSQIAKEARLLEEAQRDLRDKMYRRV